MGLLALCFLLLLGDPAQAATPAKPADPTILPSTTKIYRVVVNSFWETNCYILAGKTGQAIIIDPGDELTWLGGNRYRPTGTDAKRIYDTLLAHKLKLKYIVLSHGHIDHIGALKYLKERTGATILMHAGDMRDLHANVVPPPAKGSKPDGYAKDTHMVEGGLPKIDRLLTDGELLSLDGMVLRVMHTPGHSPGGICLFTRQNGRPVLFSGDILLYHTVGRTNFRDGSGDEALRDRMIRERLYALPDNTLVFPGHYQSTTIGDEKVNNVFVPLVPPAPAPPEETTPAPVPD